ncbi:APC family permease [Arthrobacter sp. CDRTa11]|uniref:APC family permease n=1 Tax=Arthrobacter sp. CDRTa11 TaxID=2651199 RepID=UPI002265F6DF|nr:APC family permease [Arthrobacter sp. CDRTa11]UZX02922.1 APC family permease [Arthrobacter sp. CDRTa11]
MNSSTSQTAPSEAAASPRYKRVLGLPALVLFGLAYMVPLTVFTTFGYVSVMSEGHVAAAYIVTLIAMLFTATSYGAMVKAHPSSGSTYTFVRRTFGANTSFVVGWALLLDYILLPMICYLFLGIYLQPYTPEVPVAVWIVGAVVLVTGLNILGIKMVAKMNLVMVGFQLVFIAVFILASVQTMGGQDLPSPITPFFSPDMPIGGVIAGAAMLCLSFLGFDAVSTLAEETDNPRVKIPRAILLCTLIGGGLYIGIAYTAQMVFPGYTFENVDAATLEVMTHAGGEWLSVFFTAAYCAGLFACAMASQASVSRILYAMGRDAALPKRVFGQMNTRFSTPVNATVISGAFGLTALFIDGTTAAALISFGALSAFTFVNLTVIKHYVIDKGNRGARAILRYAVVPGIGVALTLWLWTQLTEVAFWVGFIWIGLGLVWLLSLTRMFRRPLPEVTFEEIETPELPVRTSQEATAGNP